jgi:hypothetical protein
MIRFFAYLLSFLLALAANSSQAQQPPEFEPALAAMKQLQIAFGTRPVAFDVKYIYTNETTQSRVLDSVSGTVRMNGSNYRSLLENTETIRNERYNIVLFKEDKIMHVSRASDIQSAGDPLDMMKIALRDAGAKKCEVSSKGPLKIIRIGFGEDAMCKSMEMTMDTVNSRLVSMQYTVKTSLLGAEPVSGEEVKEAGYEEYALVRTSFYNYRNLPADTSQFDERTFFVKEGKELKTTAAYSNFKIFIGSPDL